MNQNTDFVIYIDTDSNYVNLNEFLKSQGVDIEVWNNLPLKQKTEFLVRIGNIVNNYVNDQSYERTQKQDYNSQVDRDDFTIKFEFETVSPTILLCQKKKYTYSKSWDDGYFLDDPKMTVKGLEIVRGDTPTLFRDGLKEMLKAILDEKSDSEIIDILNHYKNQAYSAIKLVIFLQDSFVIVILYPCRTPFTSFGSFGIMSIIL